MKWHTQAQLVSFSDMAAALSSNCTFAPPKTGNLKFRPTSDVLESGPECRRLRPDGGWDAGGETARETENLATWGGESGRGRRAAREIPGAGRVGRQNFRFSVFQRTDTQISRAGVYYVPKAEAGY
jgi:hypothetical protein